MYKYKINLKGEKWYFCVDHCGEWEIDFLISLEQAPLKGIGWDFWWIKMWAKGGASLGTQSSLEWVAIDQVIEDCSYKIIHFVEDQKSKEFILYGFSMQIEVFLPKLEKGVAIIDSKIIKLLVNAMYSDLVGMESSCHKFP